MDVAVKLPPFKPPKVAAVEYEAPQLLPLPDLLDEEVRTSCLSHLSQLAYMQKVERILHVQSAYAEMNAQLSNVHSVRVQTPHEQRLALYAHWHRQYILCHSDADTRNKRRSCITCCSARSMLECLCPSSCTLLAQKHSMRVMLPA